MAKYLVEDQVGFDVALVGFPKLGGCMAVVLQTTGGLYGFHITPGNTAKVAQFAQFVTSSGPGGNHIKLYGSCYWDNRYHGQNQQTAWKNEMIQIATALNFQGAVRGYDMSSFTSHADKSVSATGVHQGNNYLEYRRNTNNCKIFYKKMSKMNLTPGFVTPLDPVQLIRKNPATGLMDRMDPYKSKITTRADIIPTGGNKGELHEVGYFGKHSFTIP